jgi:uncharacterized phage protein gp47/JayE
MADYGLLSTGFVPKTLEVLRTEVEDDEKSAFGSTLDVSDTSLLGQINGIVCEQFAELWEGLEAVYHSQGSDESTDAALDAVCLLTGTVREAARSSEVVLTLTGDNGTSVPAENQASVDGTGDIFQTLESVTLETLDAWVDNTAYVIGDRVTNVDRCYICITSGTSENGGAGPTSTSDDITDGTAHWRYMGEGDSAADVEAESVETGVVVGNSGTITVIETPVSGWQFVINLEDADLGADIETDESLRIRRELELARAGKSPADAIRADILDVEGVTHATVFYNDTDETDADGVPPHSVEVLVRGGDDQDIWDTLFDSVAAGIRTFGTEEGTTEDSEGTEHPIKFSRPEEIEIYVDVFVTKDPDTYPADGDDQIKEAIVTAGDARGTGLDAVASWVTAQVFSVTGVLDVTGVQIDDAPAPSGSATIPITKRQLAKYDTSRITVTAINGEP